MAIAVALVIAALIIAAPAPTSHIIVDGQALRSTHGVPVRVSAPSGYRLLRPTSRHAEFNGHPFEVTLAALAGGDSVLMFHAEKVTDASGASNYDNLALSPWSGFRTRSQCASIANEDLAEEHDLKWLADRNWSPVGSLALEQHFKSTPDHNQEVVVTLIVRVKDCGDKVAVKQALDTLRKRVRVIAL